MLESLEQSNIKRMAVEKSKEQKFFDEYEVVPDHIWSRAMGDLLAQAESFDARKFAVPQERAKAKEFFVKASNMKVVCPERFGEFERKLPDNGMAAGELLRSMDRTMVTPAAFDNFLEVAPAIKNLYPAMEFGSALERETWKRSKESLNKDISERVKGIVENPGSWGPDRDLETIDFLDKLSVFNIAFPSEIQVSDELYKLLEDKIAQAKEKNDFLRSSYIFISKSLFPDKLHTETTEKEFKFSKEWIRKQVEGTSTSQGQELIDRAASWKFIIFPARMGEKGFEFKDPDVTVEDVVPPLMPEQKQF